MGILNQVRKGWNAFLNRDPTIERQMTVGASRSNPALQPTNYFDKSVVTAVYNRIAVDCSDIDIFHVRVDDDGMYRSKIDDSLQYCLTSEANKDQTARAFKIDAVMSLCEEGVIAIVPIDTTVDPYDTESFEINSMRVCKITEWYPDAIRVKAYNDRIGDYDELVMPKSRCAIIENPWYAVMNSSDSVVKRLLSKFRLLDVVDEAASSNKLNIIFQVPYRIKGDLRKQQAEERRKDLETQIMESKYGVGYIDSTEKIIQLNRPLENGLLGEIEYLTKLMYSQLCVTESILNGSASEAEMANYYSRTIQPILSAITEGMEVKFLSKTARTQKQALRFFRDPFKLVPTDKVAEIADKFTRNEIMSSNEFRQIVGRRPVEDPQADELRNKNINAGEGQTFATTGETQMPPPQQGNAEIQNEGTSSPMPEQPATGLQKVQVNTNAFDKGGQ